MEVGNEKRFLKDDVGDFPRSARKNPTRVPLYPTKKRKKAIRCAAAIGFFHLRQSRRSKLRSMSKMKKATHFRGWLSFSF
jgi:hypothetical protein